MKKLGVSLLSLSLALSLAACGNSAEGDAGTTVVASFYPFAFVAEQVGGTHVNVSNLTSPGVEPHDVELKPKQVGAVQDADLVIFEKNFQSAVDHAIAQAGRPTSDTLDVAELVSLKLVQPGAEHDEHDEQDHAHGQAADPHTWLDPTNMITVAENVAADLARIDPENAASYRANADRLIDDLSSLDRELTEGLATCRTRTIVTSHAAFQYLAARYDLTQVPIAGVDPASEPSPAQLASITRLVRTQGITTIFTEELVSPAIADTIAKETGARTATLDPIEGLSDQTADETYLTLMRKNLHTLRKANSCS